MKYKEYGLKNKDIIILLHGGGLSWWNYIDEIGLLEDEFHIVIPILDGHSDSDTNFISIENNASEIINFINENYNGKVKLIGGLSLGGQVLLEILSRNPNICEYAVIESALVIPMKFTYKMIEPIFNLTYGLTKKSWFSKLQFKNLKIKNSLYDLYYEDTCKISKNNLIAFMKSNSSYELKDTLSRTRAKVLILVGSKERSIMKKSAVKIAELIPNSELEILQGYYHGDISINHADDYVERVKRLVR
ncbi:alpha/beta hydrolase [Streptococcus anginosus]|uniref:Alpha/beta hydrolase n=2 Tax=Streptococcus anginosus TaxID=1328 RepID=A0ABD4U439_STRAP|nr:MULTISPECIES: alpha/beta hydrolase [Streptococcus]KUM01001.1 alpha/beta hydrolase [Streptococcus anginosus]MCW1076873.1 alpha/beta hydrolase [Streptococcus anginosus]MDB8655683.1 alpha/beta hydrolase [Streptococcus anginosus]MDB8659192.1 alpha/beta hydrolase [Streptococcus anginosus]OFL63554.1 alpha/beta hydrolase [Streptococcus sp. HMSC057E02]